MTTGSTDSRQQLRERRIERRLLEEDIRVGRLRQAKKRVELRESAEAWEWIDAWSDVIDRMRGPAGDGFGPVSTAADRRYGANWPFWRSWWEHARLRASARVLWQMSPGPKGVLDGIGGYVVEEGFKFPAKARPSAGAVPPELVAAVNEAISDFTAHNEWGPLQHEQFVRTQRDGDTALRHFALDDGMLAVRCVNSEQIVEPTGCDPETSSFGIETDAEDLETILGLWVAYDGDASHAELVPTEELTYFKVNTDRGIKRGLSDLSFDTYDMFKSCARLTENMGEGAAVQYAMALIVQHEGSSADEVSEFVSGAADRTAPDPFRGQDTPTTRYSPGRREDIPKGMNYVPPPIWANATTGVTIAQALLRSIAVRWNAPEWITSGDASNNNYSSSLTAEAPFTRSCKRTQGYYGPRFNRTVEAAVKARCDAGRLRACGRTWTYREVCRLVEITAEAPKLQVRDPKDQAEESRLLIDAGLSSRQIECAKTGNDWHQVERDNEEWEKKHGPGAAGPSPANDAPSVPDVEPTPPPIPAEQAAPLETSPAEPADVQDTALNGAQITALTAIVTQQAEGTLSAPAAAAILQASFPLLDPAVIGRIVSAIANQPAPAPVPVDDQAPVTESLDDEEPGTLGVALLEAGFTGEIKDKLGRTRHYVDGKQVAAPTKQKAAPRKAAAAARVAPAKKEKATPEQAKSLIAKGLKGEASVEDVSKALMSLTVAQIGAIKKDLGLKASGPKAELARKVAERALAAVKGPEKKPAPAPAPAPAPKEQPKASPPSETHLSAIASAWGDAGGKLEPSRVEIGKLYDTASTLADSIHGEPMSRDQFHAALRQLHAEGMKVPLPPDEKSEPPTIDSKAVAGRLVDALKAIQTSGAGRKELGGARQLVASVKDALPGMHKADLVQIAGDLFGGDHARMAKEDEPALRKRIAGSLDQNLTSLLRGLEGHPGQKDGPEEAVDRGADRLPPPEEKPAKKSAPKKAPAAKPKAAPLPKTGLPLIDALPADAGPADRAKAVYESAGMLGLLTYSDHARGAAATENVLRALFDGTSARDRAEMAAAMGMKGVTPAKATEAMLRQRITARYGMAMRARAGDEVEHLQGQDAARAKAAEELRQKGYDPEAADPALYATPAKRK